MTDDRAPFDEPREHWQVRVAVTLAIFALAVLVRLPSSGESFWLDELHSAWTVWGTWDEVAPRAIAGNQTPTYFWFLWIWRQLVGNAEWLLRLPSIIASAATAAIVTWQLSRAYQQTLLATIIGAALSVESNAIFFGTELRPFAIVMLLSSVACVLLTSYRLRRSHALLGLLLVTLASAAIQPISLGVFVPLLIIAWVSLPSSEHRSFAHAHLPNAPAMKKHRPIAWIGLTLVVVIVSWQSWLVLRPAWVNRQQWDAFASGTSWRSWWSAWPWAALVVYPLCVRGLMKFSLRVDRTVPATKQTQPETRIGFPWWGFTLAGVLAVLVFWLLAISHIAPVFHRRYFVASLPLLMFGAGAILAPGEKLRWGRSNFQLASVLRQVVITLGVILPLIVLLMTQSTGTKLARGDLLVVRRGEGWREAVAYISRSSSPAETVFLQTGLVEAPRLLSAAARGDIPDAKVQTYLTFPLSGPYQVANVKAVDRPPQASAHAPFQLVLRGNRSQAKAWAQRIRPQGMGLSIQSFGQVCVIENGSHP